MVKDLEFDKNNIKKQKNKSDHQNELLQNAEISESINEDLISNLGNKETLGPKIIIERSHCVVAYLESINDLDPPQTYCYICDCFIYNPYISKITYLNSSNLNFSEKIETSKIKEKSCDSNITGIKNEGQTCYISSVLQLLSTALKEQNVDLLSHFEMCEENV